MINQEYQYTPDSPAPAPDPQQIQFEEEKRDLRARCNSVGLMMLLASVIFLTFSTIIAFIYYLMLGQGSLPLSIDSIPNNILGGLGNVAAIGICGAVFIKMRRKKATDVLIFEKVNTKKLFALVAIGFTVCMVSNMLTNIFLSTVYSLGIDLNVDYEVPVSNSFIEILIYFLSTAIVPAFSEEILFRGVVLSTLRKYGDGFAVFVSSLLFGIFHANFVQLPFAFIVGLVLAWTVVYTNSMLPAMIIHAVNNGFSVISDILYTNADGWGLNTGVVDTLSFILVAAIAVVAVVAVIKLSKNDRSFMKLRKYDGILDRKTKTKMLVTSPTVIISVVLLLSESVMNHIAV